MPLVLVAQQGTHPDALVSVWLREAGYEVLYADCAADAIAAATRAAPDIALIDADLSGMDVIEIIVAIRRASTQTACVLTAMNSSFQVAAAAVRVGVSELVALPWNRDSLLAAVTRAMGRSLALAPRSSPIERESPALKRWSGLVLGIVSARDDPRTLAEWSYSLAVSTGALRNWCHTAGLPARRSLLFARILRAVHAHQTAQRSAEELMNVIDPRTLRKWIVLAGGRGKSLPSTTDDFFSRQRLILDQQAISVVRVEFTSLVGT